MDHGTVTQLSNLTTDVDIDNPTGIITTVSASTSAQSTESFTVTNSSVSSTSVITVNICNYSGTYGTNGLPSVNINNITDGSFDLIITNNHDTNSLSGILNISFIIV